MQINKLNFRWVAERLQIDRTVIYGVIANSWSLVTGPVTILLIIKYFSSELQGYYYTFGTILALKIFIETGFSAVIVSFASHEWSKLHLDTAGYIIGDLDAHSRLISLARIIFRWHFIGGFIVIVGLGIAGYIFFSLDKSSLIINWQSPWFLLCLLTGVNMWLVPALFLLEGCNQVKQIYSYRLVTGVCVTACSWTAIIIGAGLWATVVNAAVGLVCLFIFILHKYRNFFIPMISSVPTSVINWRNNLWPMQWRIALSWISGYFMSSFFTPLIFHYHGSVAAGKFGMSWSLFGALSSISIMWISPKIPQFGMLVAKKDYISLDKLFFKSSKMSIGIYVIGALILWLIICNVYKIDHPLAVKLAARIISPSSAGIFLLGLFFMYSTNPLAYYLRAHNQEPMLGVSVFSAILIALFAWILVKQFSVLGMAIAYSTVAIFFSFPYALIVWLKCRAKWHQKETPYSVPALVIQDTNNPS